MAIDPVCMMEVDENRSKYGTRYKGRNYHFCNPGCKKKFDEDPERYLKMTQEPGEKPGKSCD